MVVVGWCEGEVRMERTPQVNGFWAQVDALEVYADTCEPESLESKPFAAPCVQNTGGT